MKRMCVRKTAISQRKIKQKEEEYQSAMRGKRAQTGEKMTSMCLVVLLIYARAAHQGTSNASFCPAGSYNN